MDLVLDILDDVVLDKVWANLVPLSAFSNVYGAVNNTLVMPVASSTVSAWSQVVARLPHPPIPADDLASLYSSTAIPMSQLSAWPREYIPRQLLSLTAITLIGVHILYFLFAGLSYYFIFNHDMMRHPRFLKNQVKQEIQCSLRAFPGMMLLTLPWFQGEVMGYSQLYEGLDKYGYFYLVASVPLFLLFTDYCIYWIHRWLHVPIVYKYLHKPHHKWIIPTPFASHAFHPVDGYFQSLPYHLFAYVFPMHRVVYLVLFVLVNFWSILIHDSDMITGHPLEKLINGPAHHTLHHIYFTVNYGQYFTWADRVGNSYRQPESSLDPLLEVKTVEESKKQ
ncbi:Lathosterol oxidase [Hypsizygus marmoreus]|uniref:Lathosterol oxidase n=1 Tax=Hypsizygus marmoreus TaxID=39966 RepID=A0A369K211_HYPMA|nr:Lathosterol oxidase [Hypsizygus marmoreus]